MIIHRPFLRSPVFVVTGLILLAACAEQKNGYEQEQSVLNIPEGEATYTLKEFAKQAEVEIMFNPQSVYGVNTNAVIGEYYPHSALRIMLKDTSLTIDFDEETGAYGVMRNEL